MEPRIQYAKTSDGVSIAYAAFGAGPPLVIPPSLIASHVQMEWQLSSRREMFERFAERATVVHYDPRGAGMSQRDAVDFSPDAATLDLEAVVAQLNLDHFALYARYSMGSARLEYAASHGDRVTHLVMAEPRVGPERTRLMMLALSLAEEDFQLCTHVLSRLFAGWDSPDARPLAALIRASHTPASCRAAGEAVRDSDPLAIARQVSVPTLILYPLDDEDAVSGARAFASHIRGAQVLAVPGRFQIGNPNAAGWTAALDFVTSRPVAPDQRVPVPTIDTSVFRTILFTDIVAHTQMMQRLGDGPGREVLREHERVTREALHQHGGSEIKTIGDSFMASFPSAQKAVECAIALQRAFASNHVCGERVRIRAGINAGEPLTDGDDLFGSSVILAARSKESAGAGEIVVTDVVRQLLTGKGFLFADRGETELQGFEDPVRLYDVRWREEDA
jgi:class 3 adenylate cyclase